VGESSNPTPSAKVCFCVCFEALSKLRRDCSSILEPWFQRLGPPAVRRPVGEGAYQTSFSAN
jgi:hypothetical protein